MSSSLKYDDHHDDDDDDDVDNNGDLESVIMVSHVLDSADDTARLPHLGFGSNHFYLSQHAIIHDFKAC